jgi:hypothetical protein
MADIHVLKANIAKEFMAGNNLAAFNEAVSILKKEINNADNFRDALSSIKAGKTEETLTAYAVEQEPLTNTQKEIYKVFFLCLGKKLIPESSSEEDPLTVACQKGHKDVAQLLLSRYQELLHHQDDIDENLYKRIKNAVAATTNHSIFQLFKSASIANPYHPTHKSIQDDWSEHLSTHGDKIPVPPPTPPAPPAEKEPFFEKSTWAGLFVGIIIVGVIYAVANSPGQESLKKEFNQIARTIAEGLLGVTQESSSKEKQTAVDSILSLGGAMIIGVCGRIGAHFAPNRPKPG